MKKLGYNLTLFWLPAKLSFSLLRSAIKCYRGSRSSHHRGHMLLNRLCHRSFLLSRQKRLMSCLFALMFVYVVIYRVFGTLLNEYNFLIGLSI